MKIITLYLAFIFMLASFRVDSLQDPTIDGNRSASSSGSPQNNHGLPPKSGLPTTGGVIISRTTATQILRT